MFRVFGVFLDAIAKKSRLKRKTVGSWIQVGAIEKMTKTNHVAGVLPGQTFFKQASHMAHVFLRSCYQKISTIVASPCSGVYHLSPPIHSYVGDKPKKVLAKS